MHLPDFPSYIFYKEKWLEKLIKGTRLNGLSPQNYVPMSLLINLPAENAMYLLYANLMKSMI